MEASYDIELRENGQVEGAGGLSQSAVMAPGAEDIMKMRIPFHGSWSYDPGAKILTIESTVSLMGRQDHETIRVHTTGHEKGAITGQGLGGRTWALHRVTELCPESVAQQKSVTRAEKNQVEDLYKKGAALWSGTGYSDPRLAIDYFTQAAHLDPRAANIYHARGIAHCQLGLHREALADFNRSIFLNSNDPECFNWRGNTYYALNDRANARKDWEKACEMGSAIACQNLRKY